MTDQRAAFPDCHRCGYFRSGRPRDCLACVCRELDRPGAGACPVCSQRLGSDGRCPNELCRSPRRRIGKIHAIGYQSGPLRRSINSYKYRGTRSWSVLFGRLLLAWLDENMAADPPGLIVVNPSLVGPGGQDFAHTEAVLAEAALQDAAGRWPFDDPGRPAIVKTRATLRSADAQAWAKRASGAELREALVVPDPARTVGRYVLVYDDICTTGTQLDAIAGCLLDQGGASRVDAVILGRAPWRGAAAAGRARVVRPAL